MGSDPNSEPPIRHQGLIAVSCAFSTPTRPFMPHPIDHLLQQPEGKTLEFKRDLSSPRNVLKTLVAFANAARRLPGHRGG